MLITLILLAASLLTAGVGGAILWDAMSTGKFTGIPDQILMMTSLIASAVFLTGASLSDWLRVIHKELVRQRKAMKIVERTPGG